jgi:putative hydrolase of the HAD superfamily
MKSLKHITHIMFDVGGTLANDEPSYADGYAAMLTGLGYPSTGADYRQASDGAKGDVEEPPRELEAFKVWREGYNRAIIRRLGVPVVKVDEVRAAMKKRFRYYSNAYAYPESHFVLRSLRWAEYDVAIISNIQPVLPDLLLDLDLMRYASFAIASDTFGAQKPDRSIFDEAIRLAKVDPKNVIYVGDSIEPDIMGSSQVGMTPVLIDRGGRVTDEQLAKYDGFRIGNLVELLDRLGVDPWNAEWLHDPSRIR